MPENTTRPFGLSFRMSAPPPAGTVLRLHVDAMGVWGKPLTDVTPDDNDVTITVV